MTRANSTVFDMMNPLMQRLAASRVQAEQGARSAYGAHADALGKGLMGTAVPITQAYDTAIGSSAAVNEAVANRLKGEGGAATSGLNAQLAQISANPSTSQELGATYSGAEGAGYASGAADLQHLLGQKAEAQAYTGKLPGIARIEGGRLLAQALSEMNQEFGERESGLYADAQDKSFNLWNQFRGEDMEAKKTAKEEARDAQNTKLGMAQANADRRSKERMALEALRATATTKAEQRAYDIKLKNWDRANDVSDARADRASDVASARADHQRDLQIAQLKFDNSSRSDADKRAFQSERDAANRTFKAQQQTERITAQRTAAAKKSILAKKGKALPGKGNDTWQTAGSAKQKRVHDSIRNKIINTDTGRIRDRFGNSQTIDKDISQRIWSEIRLQVGNTTSPAAKKLYRSIFLSLRGLPVAGGTYELPQFVKP